MEFVSHWMIAPDTIESRQYQQNISKSASQKNTLVILPTALGKTVIALLTAVKRLDVYPWAKVVFLAPTRPLVMQHFDTFSKFLVLDENKISFQTGRNSPQERTAAWEESQLIFATPQVINNDLEKGRYDLAEVALLIFDEAHRARKNYAYTKIASNFIKNNADPLILALTASPGKNKERIEEICRHLFIEAIEFRTESEPDVKDYVNPIQMDWYKLDLPKEYDTIKNQLEEILHGYLKQLHYMKFFLNTPIQRISKMDLISFGNKLRSYIDNPNLENERKSYYFSAISLQAASLSLMHAMELLTTQEIETFLNFLNKLEENPSRYAQKIVDDSRFKKIRGMTELYSNVNHSKMNKLRDIVLEELESNKDSKIIAFTQYRGTASKIVGNLQTLPGVRPIRFVGQSSNSEDTGLSQNEQAEIIDDFRFGKHNVLVATSIAEEGLDIPSVELVIFYEPIPSEIRYIQRKGRTGRKKFGKVKILITQETLDEAYFYASLKRTRQMKAIVSNLEKDLKLSLNRTPLKKPTKITITEKFTGIKKKIKPRKNKYIKPETANVDPNDFDVEIQDGKVKELTIKKSERPSQILKNFKPTKTKGLNNAVNWVMRRSTECDNGDGIDIDEFLKISTLEGFDPELILAAISKLITEGLLYQPDSLKISVVQ